MPRQPKLIQLSLLGAILFGLLIGVYLAVCIRRSSKPDPAGKIIKHTVDTPPDDVLESWTPEKMRNAKPANLPDVTALERRKQRSRRSPHRSGPEHS